MAIIHGVDTDLIKQYGDISEKNEVFGSHREYKLVRGYDMPEVLASLTFLDACDVLSARFGAKLRLVDDKTEGRAFYCSQYVDDDNLRLFAIKKDDILRKGWVIHEYKFAIRKDRFKN